MPTFDYKPLKFAKCSFLGGHNACNLVLKLAKYRRTSNVKCNELARFETKTKQNYTPVSKYTHTHTNEKKQ